MKTNNKTIKVLGWTITAELNNDPHVLVDLASPCDKYGCSLACAEMTGEAESYSGNEGETMEIPHEVIDSATNLEDSYYQR